MTAIYLRASAILFLACTSFAFGEDSVAVYQTGDEVPIQLKLPADIRGSDTKVSWKVRDWNQVVQQEGSVQLPKDVLSGVTIAVKPPAPGWYEVESFANGTSFDLQTFVIGPYYKSQGDQFRYGVCSHFLITSPQDLPKLLDLQKWLGIDLIRSDLPWALMQSGPDAPFIFEAFDHIYQYLSENGIEPQLLLTFSPSWAANVPPGVSPSDAWRCAPKMDPWLKYVTASVNHYNKVKYWEVWNEEDIGGFWKNSVDEYADLFSRTSGTVANLNPNAQVLNGGFAMVSRVPNPDFVPQFLHAADRSNWQIFAYHDYMSFPDTLTRFGQAQEAMKIAGISLPLWINEGGFNTLMPGGKHEQAITLVKKLTTVAGLGVKSYVWYDMRDDGVDPNEGEHHFGLTGNDFQPKPAFAAYRELIYQVADRPVTSSHLAGSDDIYRISYGSRKQGSTAKSVHVVWKQSHGPDEPMLISSNAATDKIHIYDLMGRSIEGEAKQGREIVSIGNSPIYIECSDGDKLDVQRILKLPDRIVVLPITNQKVSIGITNPLAEQTKISMTLQYRVDGKPNPIAPVWTSQLNPDQATVANFQLDRAAMDKHLQAGAEPVELSLLLGEGGEPLNIPLNIEAPQVIGKSNSPWHVTLEDRDHIVNLHGGEPDPAMHWSGPKDLSASAWSDWDENGLHLSIDVQDDTQSQDYDTAALWKGDSVQIAAASLDNPDDYFEMVVGLLKSGTPDGWITRTSKSSSVSAGPLPPSAKVQISRNNTTTSYQVTIPWAVMGFAKAPDDPFLFNFLVNDSDGAGRKQWLQYTAGIGKEKNPRLFKPFVLKK